MGAIYYTRILKTLVFVQRPAHLPEVQEAPFSMRLSLLVLAALSLLLGLAPQLPMQLVLPVASLCFAPTPGDPQIIMALSVYWPVYVLLPVFGALLPALFAGRRKPGGLDQRGRIAGHGSAGGALRAGSGHAFFLLRPDRAPDRRVEHGLCRRLYGA